MNKKLIVQLETKEAQRLSSPCGNLVLTPGENSILEEDQAIIDQSTWAKLLMNNGLLSVHPAPEDKEITEDLAYWQSLPEKVQLKKIGESDDIFQLKDWGEAENSDKVRSAIDSRTEELVNG